MIGMEIVLLIMGAAIFVASFVVPERKNMTMPDKRVLAAEEEKVKELVDSQIKDAKEKLRETVDNTLTEAVEKSERSLEKLSNEKITAVSEFSETVLGDIHKGHQEIMFLYDMLHEKQKNLLETAKEVERTSAIARETKNELENTAKTVQEDAVKMVREEGKTAVIPTEEIKKAETGEETAGTVEVPEESEADKTGMNNNDRILEMHKQGKSNITIAKELGLGVGEVNLVIDLFEVN